MLGRNSQADRRMGKIYDGNEKKILVPALLEAAGIVNLEVGSLEVSIFCDLLGIIVDFFLTGLELEAYKK
jgi:hypothetical protein